MKKENKRLINKCIWIMALCLIVMALPVVFFHQSFGDCFINLLNGGLAMIPATLIVVWQVRSEEENKLKEERRQKNEELKITIFSLLASMNNFPQIFSHKYRISTLDGSNPNYSKIANLKEEVISFKDDFYKKGSKLQVQLIYLDEKKDQNEKIAEIIKLLVDIEMYLQRLINILNEKDLKGGLGYSELDYEEIVLKMYKLKNQLSKLPDTKLIDAKLVDSYTSSLRYYDYVIKTAKRKIEPILDKNGKITVKIFKSEIDGNTLNNLISMKSELNSMGGDEVVRDCLKIFALRKDIRNNKSQKYRFFKDKQHYDSLTIELMEKN